MANPKLSPKTPGSPPQDADQDTTAQAPEPKDALTSEQDVHDDQDDESGLIPTISRPDPTKLRAPVLTPEGWLVPETP